VSQDHDRGIRKGVVEMRLMMIVDGRAAFDRGMLKSEQPEKKQL
jgi:hypothetical protein